MKKLYFASDFHLGIYGDKNPAEREKAICAWMLKAAEDAKAIYLLGDCFDFWFEYKTVVPKGNVRFLHTLQKITESGVKVTMFKGNHDMWMFGYLKEECGIEIIDNELVFEESGKKFFLHHGDGLGKGDRSYKFLKRIFRSQLCQWLFARLHPNLGIGIARRWSKGSRLAKQDKFNVYYGDDKEIITQYFLEMSKTSDIDYYICGHRHLALDIPLNRGARYINLADWYKNPHYGVFDGKEFALVKVEL